MVRTYVHQKFVPEQSLSKGDALLFQWEGPQTAGASVEDRNKRTMSSSLAASLRGGCRVAMKHIGTQGDSAKERIEGVQQEAE